MKKDYNFSPRLFWRIKQSKNQAKNQTNQQISSFLIGMFCICFSTLLDAQLTIRVTTIPASTPAGSIYVSGTFNNWNPADPNKTLTQTTSGVQTITINPAPGQVEFKFTRGSWETAECSTTGGFQPNHKVSYNGQAKTIEVVILGWTDAFVTPVTPGNGTVTIMNEDFYIPELARTRRIWMYLPPDYNSNPGKIYPVIYMQDGQNLFDDATAANGEWGVDETMNQLINSGDPGCIIVGIDNGGVHTLDEYSPWVNPAFGGGQGIDYMNFIVNTLKPYIDNNYRTIPDREHTALMGSGMGGVISLYGLLEHQSVFSKAGVFSPSLWFVGNKELQHIHNVGKQSDVRIYFLHGALEPSSMTSNLYGIVDAMKSVGFTPDEYNLSCPTDGEPTEWFWGREFGAAYQWLFENDKAITSTNDAKDTETTMQVYPNPATDWVRLSGDGLDQNVQIRVVASDGRVMMDEVQQGNTPIWTGDLPRGVFAIQVVRSKGAIETLQLIHE